MSLNAEEISEINEKNTFLLKEFIKTSEYILGPGDKLYIKFFGAPDFSGDVDILNDGTISVPIIGDVYIQGLTKKMAEEKIEELIKETLIVNNIQLKVKKSRKIKIAIIGEVINPGVYSLSEEEYSYVNQKQLSEYKDVAIVGVPTLVDAIQKSGGLNKNADLSNILIKRKSPNMNNYDSYKYTYSNLIKLLTEGDFNQNLALFDGDVITISENLDKNNFSASLGNLTPYKIDLFVIGEVKEPGLIRVNANSSISKAILAAGGFETFKANRKKIKVFSEDGKGNYKLKNYTYSLGDDLKNNKKYSLSDGDVIIVGKKSISTAFDAVDTITPKFLGFNYVLTFLEKLGIKK